MNERTQMPIKLGKRQPWAVQFHSRAARRDVPNPCSNRRRPMQLQRRRNGTAHVPACCPGTPIECLTAPSMPEAAAAKETSMTKT